MKKRIWFNNWFNSAYHFIDLIKNNPDGRKFEVFGTNLNPKSVVLYACDHSEVEPAMEREQYIGYSLAFCKKHRIDVFIPWYRMLDISANVKEFEALGTRVMVCADTALLAMVMNKAKFYEACKKSGVVTLPEYRVVNTAEEFLAAYQELLEKGLEVCFKPVDAVGGSGFRVVHDAADSVKSLWGPVTNKISLESALKILSSTPRFDDLLVLEYLTGYEYSIDCLAGDGLLAAVPRKKIDGRVRKLEEAPQLMGIAQKVAKTYPLSYVFNVQVKYSNGVPKLLEVNPRMSGGLHISCLSGVNFPYLAVKLLLEGKVDVPEPQFGITATQMEAVVRL